MTRDSVAGVAASLSAAADLRPEARVTIAGGTHEKPGIGGTGKAFVDSLGGQVGGTPVGVVHGLHGFTTAAFTGAAMAAGRL